VRVQDAASDAPLLDIDFHDFTLARLWNGNGKQCAGVHVASCVMALAAAGDGALFAETRRAAMACSSRCMNG